MGDRQHIRYQTFQILLVAIAALGLSACGFQIQEPAAGSAVTPTAASTIKVVLTANASFTLTKVTLDGADVTSQLIYKGSDVYELPLALGKIHSIVATADVYCFYCTGQKWQMTDTKTFCVADPVTAAGAPTFTVVAKSDQMSWASLSSVPQGLSLASDSGTNTSRFKLTRVGGIASPFGTIQPIQSYPCLCASSPDDNQNSPITLAFCDSNDLHQRWSGIAKESESSGGTITKEFFAFERAAFVMTEGTDNKGNKIVIQNNTDLPGQLWAVRDNATNQFVKDSSPWP
jgi:hypothetical protein